MINVGIVGWGLMGQTHFAAFEKHPNARVVAICSRTDPRDKNLVSGNIGGASTLDLSGVRVSNEFQDLLQNPDIHLLDLCLPTPMHEQTTVAALRAGKHVLCEKPMALSLSECDAMLAAQQESGNFLMIAHCLRFWPCYTRAHELLQSGELGRILYARLERSSQAPQWSAWLLDETQSGGVLDLHIHDIDTALWWFGAPDDVRASGVSRDNLLTQIDAQWSYTDGLLVHLHGGWDFNPVPFRMSFTLVGERGTLSFDSRLHTALQLHRNGATHELEVASGDGYDGEIAYLLHCIATDSQPFRATPQSSRLAVELALREKSQIASRS